MRLAAAGDRPIIGITGPPGAGKSTFAGALAHRLIDGGHRVIVVPMDGFHLAHARLDELGLTRIKGSPVTFDPEGFVQLIRRISLQHNEIVWAPAFDRTIEDPIAGSIAIRPDHEVILTEGNYLLLDDGPWAAIRPLLAECWYVDPPHDVRVARLVARHERHGRTPEEARKHALGSDESNAQLIAATKTRADWIIEPDDEVRPDGA